MEEPTNDFEQEAKQGRDPTFFRELWDFLRHNKKWWLLPILIILLLFSLLIFLSGTPAAPWIYSLH
ncbi:MAG: DUF5989 family protein [Gemmataceae bacterium]